MWRPHATSCLVGQLAWIGTNRVQTLDSIYKSAEEIKISHLIIGKAMSTLEGQHTSQFIDQYPGKNAASIRRCQIGENVPRKDKINFLVNTVLDLKDSKEDVYGTLDAWVAWEQTFPIASLKKALIALEKEQQWHRVVQVIKWMLSKGQGCTMGTYGQLVYALDMDHRAEEAHEFWEKKIGTDLHSVPWQLCKRMISIYYRNNMLERLVKLFKGLEAFDRKPPEKSIVQRVADAYEVLGILEDKERVLEKYKDLFTEKSKRCHKKLKASSSMQGKKSGHRKDPPISDDTAGVKEDVQ